VSIEQAGVVFTEAASDSSRRSAVRSHCNLTREQVTERIAMPPSSVHFNGSVNLPDAETVMQEISSRIPMGSAV